MSKNIIQVPKGTRDLSGDEVRAFQSLEATARRVFDLYQFSEVRTPIFESAELFSRSLGETSDVVEKEMFVFSDRGERNFALRPEGTAGVVRHYIENNLWVKSGLNRLYYMGPMFRAERPQAGRYRQFFQIGSEFFGSAEPSADADTVLMISKIMTNFGVTNFTIEVNTLGCTNCRPAHRKALLAYLKTKEKDLTEESRKRMDVNPLRVLDSKVDGPKLNDAPVMKDFLCEDCKKHYQEFLNLSDKAGAKLHENTRLVRGLDYYTRTVFEFVSPDLGAQSALAAGGRYDGLVEMLGGPATPAVGFALGMDRMVMAAGKSPASNHVSHTVKALVIPLSDVAVESAFELAHSLRAKDVSISPISAGKKLKNQLSTAAESGAKWAVLIGEDELKSGQFTLKNLETREQIQVPKSDVLKKITTPS